MLAFHEYIIDDSLLVCRKVLCRRMPVTQMLKQHMCCTIMAIIHAVDVTVYLLRGLPASWPLSLDQPIFLLPHLFCIFFFFILLRKKTLIFKTAVVMIYLIPYVNTSIEIVLLFCTIFPQYQYHLIRKLSVKIMCSGLSLFLVRQIDRQIYVMFKHILKALTQTKHSSKTCCSENMASAFTSSRDKNAEDWNKDISVVLWTEPSLTFLHHLTYRGHAVEKWWRPVNRRKWIPTEGRERQSSLSFNNTTDCFSEDLSITILCVLSAWNFTIPLFTC